MKKKLGTFLLTSPQYLQQDTAPGNMTGLVVDNKDVDMSNLVRVTMYPADGDYPDIDIYTHYWCEVATALRGQCGTLEIGDRVRVSFDTGDKQTPQIVGIIRAHPGGDETLPWNHQQCSDIPAEAWNYANLRPESIVFAKSGAGNAVWMNDILLNRQIFAASINLQDIGGKYVKIKTFKLDATPYCPIDEIPEGQGSLYQGSFGDYTVTRKGYEDIENLDLDAGSVELGHQRVKRELTTSKTASLTTDRMIQKSDPTTITTEEVSTQETWMSRQSNSVMSMTQDLVTLHSPSAVVINELLVPPRRWDT